MKRFLTTTIPVLLSFVFVLAGCTNTTEKAVPLTQEELEYFNGTQFFNWDYADNVIDTVNIRNQFLSSTYDDIRDINLFEIFYCGGGIKESITDDELLTAGIANGMSENIDDWPVPCTKISAERMNAVLRENTGLTLEETNKIELSKFIYLAEYDSYYIFHGDSNYRASISFQSGERKDNIIRLYYEDDFYGDGEKVLTLLKKDGAYLFVSNQKAES